MQIVRIFGGLGNQMFQFVFSKYLELDNPDIKIDISDYRIHKHHNGFELNSLFNISFSEASKEELKRVSINHNSAVLRLAKKKGIIFQKQSEITEEKNHCFFMNRAKLEKDYYFNGYWQNANYVKEVSENTKEIFPWRYELSGKNKNLIDSLEEYETVSIHIRCGDYIGNPSLGGICNQQYYTSAIRYCIDNIPNIHFAVFSDDISWVKTHLTLREKCTYIDWNTGSNSFQDMILMSKCKHNIIANSSFGWWGAWLNNNADKTVISPNRFFQSSECTDIYPDEWIRL